MSKNIKPEEIKKPQRNFWRWVLLMIIALQIGIYSIRLNDPFVDGRFHVNWGPPFWLLKAEKMQQVNFFKGYLGAITDIKDSPAGKVANGWYSSHPQFIAIPLFIWTKIFGFNEWVVRSLVALVTILTSIIFWFAIRERHNGRQAAVFLLVWALTPMLVTFGSKLDQEPFVMFFLALAFWGHERYLNKQKGFPWLWVLAIIGLLWSDWSGFIFAGLFLVWQFGVSFVYQPAKKLWLGALLGWGIGAGIVGTQTVLESRAGGGGSGAGVVGELFSLYKYRSSTEIPNFWYQWMQHQLQFFWTNYAWFIGYGAVAILGAKIYQLINSGKEALRSGSNFWQLSTIIFIGTLLYAVAVPQATYIHIYYQYFYSVPVAYGVMCGFEWLYKKIDHTKMVVPLAPALLVLVVFVSAYSSWLSMFADRVQGWGSPADLELIKQFRTSKPEDKIIFVGLNMKPWFDNPNIEYYAGRVIPVFEPVPEIDANTVLIQRNSVEAKLASLNKDLAKKPFHYSQGPCSPNFCLLLRD